MVLGLESRLAKDALESAWFTVEIAIDENAVNKAQHTDDNEMYGHGHTNSSNDEPKRC